MIEAGVAHITRSLAIAEVLIGRGHRVLFCLPKNKEHFIRDKKIELVSISEEHADQGKVDNLKNPQYLLPFVKEEIEILNKYKPDIAVIDLRISAVVACAYVNILTFFITGTDGLPYENYVPNFGLHPLIHSLLNWPMKKIIWYIKLQFVKALPKVSKVIGRETNVDDLFKYMVYINPEVAEYMPREDRRLQVYNVGPIFWKGFEVNEPPWLKKIRPNGKTIYLTFGGTGYDSQKLVALASLLADRGYRVIVSCSNIAKVASFPKKRNLFVAKYLPGLAVTKRVDLVVCHGGQGTMMQALYCGKPVVAVPFNPDQVVHGFRFQELGLGKCISTISISTIFGFNWTKFEEMGRNIKPEKIIGVVKGVFQEKEKYKIAVEKFQKYLPDFKADEQAADIIESRK